MADPAPAAPGRSSARAAGRRAWRAGGARPQQGRECGGRLRIVGSMRERAPVVRVLVRPGTNPRRPAAIARWVRWMLPAALLIFSDVTPDALPGDDDVITLDADDVDAGPLSVASAIQKALVRR